LACTQSGKGIPSILYRNRCPISNLAGAGVFEAEDLPGIESPLLHRRSRKRGQTGACFENGFSKGFTSRYSLPRATEEHLANELAICFEIPSGLPRNGPRPADNEYPTICSATTQQSCASNQQGILDTDEHGSKTKCLESVFTCVICVPILLFEEFALYLPQSTVSVLLRLRGKSGSYPRATLRR